MRYIVFLLIICLLISSCEKQETSKPDTDDFDIIAKIIDSKLGMWRAFSVSKDQNFDVNDFRLDSTVQLNYSYTYDCLPKNNIYEEMYYYIYSPDSTKIIDIYSYKAGLDTAGGKPTALFDVDTEALLIDLKAENSYRLLFLGTMSELHDAAWIDNYSFIITGYSEILEQAVSEDPFFQPEILYFDLLNKRMLSYKNHSTSIKRSKLDYYRYKFNEIIEIE